MNGPGDILIHNRLDNLDALRGLCAILVFFQHALPLKLLGSGFFLNTPTFYIDIGRIGVGAFFLVSGYVIPFSIRENSTLRSFWIGRLFRLWPAYIVSIVLALMLNVEESRSLAPSSMILNLTMLQQFFGVRNILGVFWTLQIELIFYFVISLMLLSRVIHDYNKVRSIFYFFLAATVALALMRFILGIKFPVALLIGLSLMFYATDLRFCRIRGVKTSYFRMAALVVVLSVACRLAYGAELDLDENPYRFILAYVAALGLFIFFEKCTAAPRQLVFFGVISYSFYLMHPIVLHVLHGANFSSLNLAVAFAVTVGVSMLSWQLIEKPFQRLGREINMKVCFTRKREI